MLIHKNKEELETLAQSLEKLPAEGKGLTEILYREWTRQQTLNSLLRNANYTRNTPAVQGGRQYVSWSDEVSCHSTDNPTTVIDDYWGLRLGLIRG